MKTYQSILSVTYRKNIEIAKRKNEICIDTASFNYKKYGLSYPMFRTMEYQDKNNAKYRE